MPAANGGRTAKRDVTVKKLDIEHVVPADVPTVFANQVVVQVDQHDAFIQFFEIRPPILLGDEEEKARQLEGLESIQATCVARVAISPSRLRSIIDALKMQYDKYLAANEEESDEDSHG